MSNGPGDRSVDDGDGVHGNADDGNGDHGNADDRDADGRVPDVEVSWSGVTETYVVALERFIRGVELATATVFAALFAIGVADLLLQIVQSARTGAITDPLVVISFIDTGLLLLIIVEVYQTVLAYVQESETRSIVRLIIYTGVIAMVRKAIIFRTGEYGTTQDALFAAVAYTVIIFGLVAVLLTERVYGETRLIESE